MIRFKTAVVVVVAALALVAAGCHDRNPPRSAGKGDKTKTTRTQQSSDVRAVDANTQKAEAWVISGDDDTPKSVTPEVKQGKGKAPRPVRPTQPAEPPKPEEPTFTVAGDAYDATKEKARETAIHEAVQKVHDYLLEQDPPVNRMPTIEMVRKMLIKHPGASEADAEFGLVREQPIEPPGGKVETRYQVEVAVKVRPEHIRELRSQERSSEALWVLAGLAGLALVCAVFFKIDAWTKGYLTSWLVLGTIGSATLLLGLWWWAK
jgi:hypothetical protein